MPLISPLKYKSFSWLSLINNIPVPEGIAHVASNAVQIYNASGTLIRQFTTLMSAASDEDFRPCYSKYDNHIMICSRGKEDFYIYNMNGTLSKSLTSPVYYNFACGRSRDFYYVYILSDVTRHKIWKINSSGTSYGSFELSPMLNTGTTCKYAQFFCYDDCVILLPQEQYFSSYGCYLFDPSDNSVKKVSTQWFFGY